MKRFVCFLLAALILLPGCVAAEQLNYDEMTLDELNKVIDMADAAISEHHTVSYALRTKLSRMTRDLVGSMLTQGEMNWTGADWLYERSWDELTVYSVAILVKDGVSSSCDVNAVFIEDGDNCLPVLLTIDEETLLDRRGDEAYLAGYDDAPVDDASQPTVEFVDDLAADDEEDSQVSVLTDEEELMAGATPIEEADVGTDSEGASESWQTPEPLVTPQPTPTPTPAPSKDVIVAKESDKGDAVKQIQQWLIKLGYLKEEADGIYGKKTSEAVKAYQANAGEDITGSVTEALFAALREKAEPSAAEDASEAAPQTTPAIDDGVIIAQSSSKGDVVKDIQTRLKKLGFLSDTPDGRYGAKTSLAVSNFQRSQGLNETGKVTKALYNKLLALTRRASIVGFDSFLMVFVEAEKYAQFNVELRSPEIPKTGGTVTYKLDQYTTVKIVVDGDRAVKTVSVEGTPDGFAEGDKSVLSAYQSALVACGAVTGPLEGRQFLEQIGAYKGAILETGEGSTIIDDIKYSWKGESGAVSLSITVEI